MRLGSAISIKSWTESLLKSLSPLSLEYSISLVVLSSTLLTCRTSNNPLNSLISFSEVNQILIVFIFGSDNLGLYICYGIWYKHALQYQMLMSSNLVSLLGEVRKSTFDVGLWELFVDIIFDCLHFVWVARAGAVLDYERGFLLFGHVYLTDPI